MPRQKATPEAGDVRATDMSLRGCTWVGIPAPGPTPVPWDCPLARAVSGREQASAEV